MLKILAKIIDIISKLKNIFVKADKIAQDVKEVIPEQPPKDNA